MCVLLEVCENRQGTLPTLKSLNDSLHKEGREKSSPFVTRSLKSFLLKATATQTSSLPPRLYPTCKRGLVAFGSLHTKAQGGGYIIISGEGEEEKEESEKKEGEVWLGTSRTLT